MAEKSSKSSEQAKNADNASQSTILSGNHAALWHGRFTEGPTAEAVAFETSINVDSRMALDDITGSIAHARMLGKQNIIPAEDADLIVKTLREIAEELTSGKLVIDTTAEDIHSFIEGVLTDRIGDAGRKVHTGRSRNDQIALDERLYLRHAVPELQSSLVTLVETITSIAAQHRKTLMPGYTHMQRAQPVTLAHHLMAWCYPLMRDYERLTDALQRIDFMPLGAGALAASSLPLDRAAVARELGFAGVTPNSLDTVSDRDYCIEIVSDLSLLMTHLSRFCEEIVLWSTAEFRFITLSEKWSTGSSIMPQKKNPDFAELIRGRTGLVYGNLIALLTMMKGLPLSYNRDLQEDKTSLFAAYDTALSCLRVFTSMISTATWNEEIMAQACVGGHANATDLAEYLVRKGMPFRTAHAVSATAVRYCIDTCCNLEDLDVTDLKKFSDLIGDDVYSCLSPSACVKARDIVGGPNPEQSLARLLDLARWITAARETLADTE